MGTLTVEFDYGFLPAADGKSLESRAKNIDRIQERVRKLTAESVVKLGDELREANAVLAKHGTGTFGRWAKERCGISKMYASRAMRASEAFNGNKLLPSFDASALYILSADTCPEEAFDEAIAAAEAGETVTHKRAKEIIGKHTPEPEADDEQTGWALHDALEYLNETMADIDSRWPAEFKEVLGRKLIDMGQSIVELASQQEDAA